MPCRLCHRAGQVFTQGREVKELDMSSNGWSGKHRRINPSPVLRRKASTLYLHCLAEAP